MSRYYETEQDSRHDHHDEDRNGPAPWFQGHNPNAGEVAAPQREDADGYVRESMTLLPPPSHSRPRSVPPNDSGAVIRRGRSWSRSSSRSSSPDGYRSRRGLSNHSHSHSRTRTPINRAREMVEDNFTTSTTGIGAGIIGAVVGGFVANRASEALQNRYNKSGHKRHDSDDANVPRIASTILGAVAGGLGANALANHLEDVHERTRDRHTWERRYSREEYDYRRSSRGRVYDREEEHDFVYTDDRKHGRRRSRDSGYRN